MAAKYAVAVAAWQWAGWGCNERRRRRREVDGLMEKTTDGGDEGTFAVADDGSITKAVATTVGTYVYLYSFA